MAYPPVFSDNEKNMLRLVESRELSNPIEWSQFVALADLQPSVFGDGIAHLVAGGLIDTGEAKQGIFRALFGGDPEVYVFITSAGKKYLASHGHTTALDDAHEAAFNETPDDKRKAIEEAVRIYMNSFSTEPNYTTEKIIEAASRLDEDVKKEIKVSALECEKMWDEYEEKFGHRSAATSDEEANFRDPVIISTTVRMFRAMDEQLRRLKLPHSRKPSSWDTHYKGGDMGLDAAPWGTEVNSSCDTL
jgi:hypothetical protein